MTFVHHYQPFGNAIELFYSRDPEVLYEGAVVLPVDL